MTEERKPVAFADMRGWMRALAAAGELHEVDAEVDWNAWQQAAATKCLSPS